MTKKGLLSSSGRARSGSPRRVVHSNRARASRAGEAGISEEAVGKEDPVQSSGISWVDELILDGKKIITICSSLSLIPFFSPFSDVAKGTSNGATRESPFALAWSFLACPTFHFEAKPALGQRQRGKDLVEMPKKKERRLARESTSV